MTFPDISRKARRQRLAESIEQMSTMVATTADAADDAGAAWRDDANKALAQARKASEEDRVHEGLTIVNGVHLRVVLASGHAQVTAEARRLEAELSSTKVRGWRQIAIRSQLAEVIACHEGVWKHGLPDRRVWLIEALRTRDDAQSNDDMDTALLRRYQTILLWIALGILVTALAGSAVANPAFADGVEKWWVALGAALSGALGGITSALQRTTRRTSTRLPQKIGSLVSSLSRPVIGAVAGTTVFLAVRAGMTQPSEQQVAYLLLVAFGAGFAERLVVRDPRDEAADQEISMRTAVHSPQTPPTATPGLASRVSGPVSSTPVDHNGHTVPSDVGT